MHFVSRCVCVCVYVFVRVRAYISWTFLLILDVNMCVWQAGLNVYVRVSSSAARSRWESTVGRLVFPAFVTMSRSGQKVALSPLALWDHPEVVTTKYRFAVDRSCIVANASTACLTGSRERELVCAFQVQEGVMFLTFGHILILDSVKIENVTAK